MKGLRLPSRTYTRPGQRNPNLPGFRIPEYQPEDSVPPVASQPWEDTGKSHQHPWAWSEGRGASFTIQICHTSMTPAKETSKAQKCIWFFYLVTAWWLLWRWTRWPQHPPPAAAAVLRALLDTSRPSSLGEEGSHDPPMLTSSTNCLCSSALCYCNCNSDFIKASPLTIKWIMKWYVWWPHLVDT